MANFGNIIKQAQQMQAKMARLQEELAKRTVEASAGGGMVTAVVNGRNELVSLKIEKDVVNPEDVEMLQDLIVAAINEGEIYRYISKPWNDEEIVKTVAEALDRQRLEAENRRLTELTQRQMEKSFRRRQ